jgi:hypothetical protein
MMTPKRIRISGNIARAAFEDPEVREAIRERLTSEGLLKHYTREEGAAAIDAFLGSEEEKNRASKNSLTPS